MKIRMIAQVNTDNTQLPVQPATLTPIIINSINVLN